MTCSTRAVARSPPRWTRTLRGFRSRIRRGIRSITARFFPRSEDRNRYNRDPDRCDRTRERHMVREIDDRGIDEAKTRGENERRLRGPANTSKRWAPKVGPPDVPRPVARRSSHETVDARIWGMSWTVSTVRERLRERRAPAALTRGITTENATTREMGGGRGSRAAASRLPGSRDKRDMSRRCRGMA